MIYTFEQVLEKLPPESRDEIGQRVELIATKNPDLSRDEIESSVAEEYKDLAFPPI